jgi:serine/threonine protein kinase
LLHLRYESHECIKEVNTKQELISAVAEYENRVIPFLDLEDEIGSLEETVRKLCRRKIAIDPAFQEQLNAKSASRDAIVADMTQFRERLQSEYTMEHFPELYWRSLGEDTNSVRTGDRFVVLDQMMYCGSYREVLSHASRFPGKLLICRSQRSGLLTAFKVIDNNEHNMLDARRWFKLSSMVLAKIHNVYQVENSLYLNTDFYDNGNLKHQLSSGVHWSAHDMVALFRHVFRALAYASRFGAVLRDLTAENILFDAQKRPVLTHYGVYRNDPTPIECDLNLPCVPPEVKEQNLHMEAHWRLYGSAVSSYSVGLLLKDVLKHFYPSAEASPSTFAKQVPTQAEADTLHSLWGVASDLLNPELLKRTTSFEMLRQFSFDDRLSLACSARLKDALVKLHKATVKPKPLHYFMIADTTDALITCLDNLDPAVLTHEWIWKLSSGQTYTLAEILPHYILHLIKENAIEVASSKKELLQESVSRLEEKCIMEDEAEYNVTTGILGIAESFVFLPVMNGKVKPSHPAVFRALGILLQKCLLDAQNVPLCFSQTLYLYLTKFDGNYLLDSVIRSIGALEEFDASSAQRCQFILSEDYQTSETSHVTFSMIMHTAGIHVAPEFDKTVLNQDKEYIITEFANALLYTQRNQALSDISAGFALGGLVQDAVSSVAHWELAALLGEDGALTYEEVWSLFDFDKDIPKNTWTYFKAVVGRASVSVLRVLLYHIFHHVSLVQLSDFNQRIYVVENIDRSASDIQFIPTLHVILLPRCLSEGAMEAALSKLLDAKYASFYPYGAWHRCKCGYPCCISNTRHMSPEQLLDQKHANDFRKCPRCKDVMSTARYGDLYESAMALNDTGEEDIPHRYKVGLGTSFFSLDNKLDETGNPTAEKHSHPLKIAEEDDESEEQHSPDKWEMVGSQEIDDSLTSLQREHKPLQPKTISRNQEYSQDLINDQKETDDENVTNSFDSLECHRRESRHYSEFNPAMIPSLAKYQDAQATVELDEKREDA